MNEQTVVMVQRWVRFPSYNNNMKFTYTHITKNYTEITEYKVTKGKVITNKIRQKSDNINK